MNFFEAQDQARRATMRLVILFLLAVATLIALTELLILAVIYSQNHFIEADVWQFAASLGAEFHISVITVIILVVALGTLYKFNQLHAGGFMVAELLGGRSLAPDSDEPAQRRLLNVVEEMAIASGIPVPTVYVLPYERGINAFAAGLNTTDAIICVTQGTLESLDRDALQGVIAHEFSHILNGDMRLNIRITCVLNGILLLGLVGARLLRYMSVRRGPSRGRGAAPVAMLGAGLMAIGFGGTFFGNLIKATVNRQREYLADASAVQFTRNPAGIATALKTIAAYAYGSRLVQPNAPQISHFFFARANSAWFEGMFATHPPLEKRIHRIEPGWDGSLPTVKNIFTEKVMTEELVDGRHDQKQQVTLATMATVSQLAQIKAPDQIRLREVQQVLTTLPAALITAARNPYYSRTLIYAMLLSPATDVRKRQVDIVNSEAEPGVEAKLTSLYKIISAFGRAYYLPLLQMAIPTLQACSRPQLEHFQRVLLHLIRSDNHVSLFEWCVMTIVGSSLQSDPDRTVHSVPGRRRLQNFQVQVRVILALLAQADSERSGPEQAYRQAMKFLQIAPGDMYSRNILHFETVDNALRQLDRIRPLEKQRLIDACVRTVESNGIVAGVELEVLQAIAAALHIPAPPLIDTPSIDTVAT